MSSFKTHDNDFSSHFVLEGDEICHEGRSQGHQLEVLQNRSRKMMFGREENEEGCRRLYNCQTS